MKTRVRRAVRPLVTEPEGAVVPRSAPSSDAGGLAPVDATDPCPHAPDRSPAASRARFRWAQVLARVYEIDPRRCPAGHRREALVVGR
jgi:hypothetical protein